MTAIPLVAQCGLCKLDQGCRTPKMGVATIVEEDFDSVKPGEV